MIRRPPRSTPKPSSAASDVYKRQDEAKYCSLVCKYTGLITQKFEKVGGPETPNKELNKVAYAAEARKALKLLIVDPDVHTVCKNQVAQYVPAPIIQNPIQPISSRLPVSVSVPPPAPSFVHQYVPPSIRPIVPAETSFKWDPECCAQNIVLSEDSRVCFLQEGGYCFRTVLANIGFTSGIQYWEIHADSRTENELKIGVACKKNFNLNTAFCDYEYGWGYYGLGQLRHGNNSSGPKYGATFKNSGYLGICLDMNKGQLSFALNGEFM
eukprot:TRINITY_DN7641_c0_g1_i1.p2 TRINITY_DN7641_c0_g1~~TRINITY_DN7641_c0_g1_i1.p2  ORF type:complete len:268 (+),score=55.89 TRINITY_DN7641_c0_g1_i1:3-806(+)